MSFVQNDRLYEAGEEGPEEERAVEETVASLFARYDPLRAEVRAAFARHADHLGHDGRHRVFHRALRADAFFIRTYYGTLPEDAFYARLSAMVSRYLPLCLENDRVFTTCHPLLCEPSNALLLAYATAVMKRADAPDGRDAFFTPFAANILRSVRAVLMLFSVGDAMHALALLRGYIEQIVRYTALLRADTGTYRRYADYNAALQKWREKDDPRAPLPRDLAAFLREKHLTPARAENYLLYGWYTVNGRPCTHLRRMAEAVLPPEFSAPLLRLYHLTSEFVHEDYAGVSYDYPALRRRAQEFLLESMARLAPGRGFPRAVVSGVEVTGDIRTLAAELGKRARNK